MKLVQIVKRLPSDTADAPGPVRYEVVAEYDLVPDAIDAITSEKHGDGPFDIVSVNRRGVRLTAVTEKVLDLGVPFGPKATKPVPGPAPTPPPSPKGDGSKSARGAAAK
jgi:hypothetical protein